eukprot:gene57900-biopygen86002
MDIAVMIPGAPSMATAFGRHPHGFYGIIEMLHAWTGLHMPMAHEHAGDPSDASARDPWRRGVARIGFVMFSGDRDAIGANGKPMGSAVLYNETDYATSHAA